MGKTTKKKGSVKEDMGKLLFAALSALEEEEGIPYADAKEMVETALLASYNSQMGIPKSIKLKDTRPESEEAAGTHIVMDQKKRTIRMFRRREVSEEITDERKQISLEEARAIDVKYELGDMVDEPIVMQFGRKASHAGKQSLLQSLGEWRRRNQSNAAAERVGEMISGIVVSVDDTGADLDTEGGRLRLPAEEMIPGERLRSGDRTRIYCLTDREAYKQPYRFSRKHPGLVRRLLELNIPEIQDGLVLIKDVAREPGSRTKVSVAASESFDGDPVGACIGERGTRINAIVDALNGEKIDVVEFSEKPEKYIASALAPAKVREVEYDGEHSAIAWVDSDQLTLAIGKEGQNVRLAAHLTGCKIDIKGQQKESSEENAEGKPEEKSEAKSGEAVEENPEEKPAEAVEADGDKT